MLQRIGFPLPSIMEDDARINKPPAKPRALPSYTIADDAHKMGRHLANRQDLAGRADPCRSRLALRQDSATAGIVATAIAA
jgi:hypothetical protein